MLAYLSYLEQKLKQWVCLTRNKLHELSSDRRKPD